MRVLAGVEGTPGQRRSPLVPSWRVRPMARPSYGELIESTSPGANRTTRFSTEIETPLTPAAKMVPW